MSTIDRWGLFASSGAGATLRNRAVACAMVLLPIAAAAAGDLTVPVFVNEAAARGLDYAVAASGTGILGNGVMLADLDGDGDLDVAVTGAIGGVLGLFENDGSGFFTSRPCPNCIPSDMICNNFGAFDYDDDGDLDLVLLIPMERPRLLRNDGDWTFTDVTEASGLGEVVFALGMSAGDIDGDGWTDLFIAHYRVGWPGMENCRHGLWRNNGDSTFTNIAPALGLDLFTLTTAVTLFDPDQDGDLDIYMSNDRGHYPGLYPNLYYRNDGGAFVEIGQRNGTGLGFYSMGIAIGDPNGDGRTDLYDSNSSSVVPPMFGATPLLLGSESGNYTQGQEAWGVSHHIFSWACHFFDANNDGTQDLFVTNQNVGNTLYLNPGAAPMIDASAASGVDGFYGKNFCVAYGDVDGDGDIDLLTNPAGSNIRLLINQTNGGANWISLDIIGEKHERSALGASVRFTQGGVTQVRHSVQGIGYLGQSSFDVHFGLGDGAAAETLVIRWPNSGSVRTLTNYPANTRWRVIPPGKMGDYDGDGVVTQADLSKLAIECGTQVVPGLEMLDMNGDASLDGADMALLVGAVAGLGGDFNSDGIVDGNDLGTMLGAWQEPCSPCDLNGDGTVDGADLGALLGNWS